MKFKILEDNTLLYLLDNNWCEVSLTPCFPTKSRREFLSVRTMKNEEVEFINSLSLLDGLSQKTLYRYLYSRGKVFNLSGIYSIVEEFGIRNWSVKTQSGDRKFQTQLDAWPVVIDGKVSIEDIYGEKYEMNKLEFGSKLLSSYIE